MLSLSPAVRIYLASEPADMRKSIDGLGAIVRNQLGEDVFSGHFFVFVSRRGDRVKILTWSRGGFVVYYKRLEKGRFRLPLVPEDAKQVEIDGTQLAMLLDGIDTRRVQRPRMWAPQPQARKGIDRSIAI
jgi:transposase